jgi:hypothetical protein
MKNPHTNEVNYWIMIGHSFGIVAAVYNYNRRSALINDFLRRIFKVASNFFYDDKFGFEPEGLCDQAHDIVRDLHRWLGADFADAKLQLDTEPIILGVEYNLKESVLEVTAARKKELREEINSYLREKRITPGQAAKLKGKLMFAATQLWGKVGRAFLRPLSETHAEEETHISELAGVFWQLAARLETSIYLDRVSTDSNPADGPSRPDKAHTYQHLKWSQAKGAWRQLLESDQSRAWEHNPVAGTCM